VPEMLAALIANGRTEHEAATELARALEDRAIVLAYRNGHVFNSEDLAPVIDLIKAFPSRSSSINTDEASQRLADGGAGAWRFQFELVCGLSQGESKAEFVPNRRITTDEDLVVEGLAGIRSGRWANAHKAAQDLAHRAEGASYDSSVQRLGQKIRKAMS